jgi:16S rRNA (guanine966-N2)-methyltransferase
MMTKGFPPLTGQAAFPSGDSSSMSESFERALERLAVGDLFLAQRCNQILRRLHAAIGLQQGVLQLLEQRLVDLAASEQLRDRRVENVASARKTCLEARRPGERYHRCVHSTNAKRAARAGKIRIIGGEYRGRRIAVPERRDLRPTPDRVRETLFNWLGQVLDGKSCLDLFAGSGALGFEAASRGAARVVMVENDRDVFFALKKTSELIGTRQVDLVLGDAFDYLERSTERFDVVFLDPPFRQNALPAVLERLAPRLASAARVYVEAADPVGPGEAWRELKRARAGQVSYQLLERR